MSFGKLLGQSITDVDVADYIRIPGTFTVATLPNGSGLGDPLSRGLLAWTSDGGMFVWSGFAWIPIGNGVPGVSSVGSDGSINVGSPTNAVTLAVNASGIKIGVLPVAFGGTGVTTSTGTGATVRNQSPALITPDLGTPSAVNLSNASNLNLAGSAPTGLLPVAKGGTGTATPGLVAGTNVTVSGTWPNQTVSASGGGGGSGTITGVSAGTGLTGGGTSGAVSLALGNTAVTPGTFTNPTLTVNQQGQITAIANGATGLIKIAPSGDTSGVTDTANLRTAIASVWASARTVTHVSSKVISYVILLVAGPVAGVQTGSFYFNDTILLATTNVSTSIAKLIGIQILTGGIGVTTQSFVPSTPRPMFVNQMFISPVIDGQWIGPYDQLSDFMWSQEQAGNSNIQNASLPDMQLQGWRHNFRLTGGNNNSEWKFNNLIIQDGYGGGFYTPPPVTGTVTNGSSSIVITPQNFGVPDVQAGDTVTCTAAMAPLTAGQQVYVLSATQSAFPVGTTAITVATSFGGTAVSFTTGATSAIAPATDQFLNFWGSRVKWWSNNGPYAAFMILNYGGSIGIDDFDISGWQPTSSFVGTAYVTAGVLTVVSITSGQPSVGDVIEFPSGTAGNGIGLRIVSGSGTTWTLNLSVTIGSSGSPVAVSSPNYAIQLLNTPSSRGVCSMDLRKVRTEHKDDYARFLYSRWGQGAITVRNWDQSSQASLVGRDKTSVQCLFEFGNNRGPKILWDGCTFIGKHGYLTNTATFNFKPRAKYQSNGSLDWERPSDFCLTSSSGGGSGGLAVVEFDDFDGDASSSGLYKAIGDCTLNFFKSYGGVGTPRVVSMVGGNSDLPNTGGAGVKVQPSLNVMVRRWRMHKPAGSNTGAFSYNLVDGNGAVIANVAGANAGALIDYDSGDLIYPLSTDTQCQLSIVDIANSGAGRGGAVFTGASVWMEILGG